METTEKIEVPQEVRSSTFGCGNCLWCSAECTQGSLYKEEIVDGDPSCARYSYYD